MADEAELGAYVVGGVFAGDTACFALGDGTVRLSASGGWRTVAAHDGAILCAAAAPDGQGIVTGGDDGAVVHTRADGTTATVARGKRWAEQVATHSSGLIAVGSGRELRLYGAAEKTFAHPSTVTGIAFDARGKRLAVSHYNGASLWFVNARDPAPRVLEWKGSHTGVLMDPAGEHVVTTMQEPALHGWRLADDQHMRMAGYPAKIASAAFTRNGRWLATAGADTVVLWPFFGGGPMGKQPTEVGGGAGVQVTRVAAHPKLDLLAAGFADGSVIAADMSGRKVLDVARPGGGPVSALAWNLAGQMLLAGTEAGHALIVALG